MVVEMFQAAEIQSVVVKRLGQHRELVALFIQEIVHQSRNGGGISVLLPERVRGNKSRDPSESGGREYEQGQRKDKSAKG